MKIKKEDLKKEIEEIIGNGVVSGEEIDATTDKVLKLTWVVIDYLQSRDVQQKEEIVRLRNESDVYYHRLRDERIENEELKEIINELRDESVCHDCPIEKLAPQ